MDTNQTKNTLMWVVSAAVVLFCATGIAVMMGWVPGRGGAANAPETAAPAGVADAPATAPQTAAGTPSAPVVAAVPGEAQPVKPAAKPTAKANTATTAKAGATTVAGATGATGATGTSAGTAKPAACADCGVIESVRQIEHRGEGSGLGGVGGAVVGGLLGNQVGGGNGRTLATIAGAVGGALAGNEIEKRVKTTSNTEIAVRMDDGTRRVFHESNEAGWQVGEHVKIVNGALRRE